MLSNKLRNQPIVISSANRMTIAHPAILHTSIIHQALALKVKANNLLKLNGNYKSRTSC
jgi:hypothetical protein